MNRGHQGMIVLALVGLLMLFSTTSTASTMDASERNRLLSVSYLNNQSYPRGIRNNNPGNIRISSSAWKAKLPASRNQDGSFEQFEGFVWGVRAMIVLLRNYINRKGLNTVRKIIASWAPASENHTAAYAKWISEATGLGLDQPITANKDTLKALTQAIAQYENGSATNWVPDDLFTLSYVMS